MKNKTKKEIISDLLIISVAIIIFYIITNYVCVFSIVSGSSMNDTLMNNDAIISFYYDLDNIDRFDIVEINNGEGKRVIKRVIGLPGEKVEYIDNKLYIDGKYIKEDFLMDGIITEDLSITINNDECFCLGDNRKNSRDSRYYGPYKIDNIISSHIFRIFPFNKIGFMD